MSFERMGQHPEFVSQDNEQYLQDGEKTTKFVRETYGNWKARHLISLERLSKRIKELEEKILSGEKNQNEVKSELLSLRRQYAVMARLPFGELFAKRQESLDMQFQAAIALQTALKDEMVQQTWVGTLEPFPDSPEKFWILFSQNNVPTATLWAILDQRKRYQEKLFLENREKIEKYRDEFCDRLKKLFEEQKMDWNPKLEERIKRLSFFAADRLYDVEARGIIHEGSSAIGIDLENAIGDQDLKETVFHEISHYLSGTIIQKGEISDNEKVFYERRKLGLRFEAKKKSITKGLWLDEAITERIAQLTSGGNEINAYKYEQTVLDDALSKGIPFKLFLDAYFEEMNEKPVDGSKLPAFRALNKEMTRVYGSGWMKKIQEKVDKQYEADRKSNK